MPQSVIIVLALAFVGSVFHSALAYPPSVGILGKSENCLTCHVNNGPWKEDAAVIIDVVDKASGASLKQADGSFLLECKRGDSKTVLTVIGVPKGVPDVPYRNAWLYVDPKGIKTSALSKFAAGWDVNLPMACRLVGDKFEAQTGANVTVLPMTVRAGDAAHNDEITLQVMLTKGESVKGDAKQGMIGNYFERKVILKVVD